MINRQLIEVFSEIAREKNIERSELGSIIEQLFLYIIEKQYGDASNCDVIVNLDKGEIEIYIEKTIVEEIDDQKCEITLEEVLKKEPELSDLTIGDPYVEVVDPAIFGRRIVAHAKNFFAQKIRDVERQYIYEDYSQRVGEIIIGVVHQVQRDNVFVNIEHAELRLPKDEQISTEKYRRGDTIRAVIKSVEVTSKGPDIVISRSDNHFLFKLFEMEVPEIEDGIIEITSIVRVPGERAKIIVHSHDRRVDASGACIGMRGSRIQAIVRELNNEKIDIVNFSEKPEVLIQRALSPGKPINLYIDDERKYCVAIFKDDELDAAIGKGGVNINLASLLTEYKIDAYGEKEYEKRQLEENTAFEDIPGFPKETIKGLIDQGIANIPKLLIVSEDTLLQSDGVTEENLELIYESVQTFVESNEEEQEEDFVSEADAEDESEDETNETKE